MSHPFSVSAYYYIGLTAKIQWTRSIIASEIGLDKLTI